MNNWWDSSPLVGKPPVDGNWWENAPIVTQRPQPEKQMLPAAQQQISSMDGFMPPDVQGMVAPAQGDIRAELGRIGNGASDVVQRVGNAASFGMANRLAALTSGKSYEEGLADQTARSNLAAERLGKVGTMLADGAGMFATGAGLANAGVTLAGRVGGGLLPRSLAYGVEGATFGAAQEAGTNYGTLQEKLNAAKQGGMTGFGVGAALPVAGAALGKGYEFIRNAISRPIEGASRGANALLKSAVREKDIAALNALGPEGMPADVSSTMLGLTQGAAIKPGASKDKIIDALTSRDAGTSNRLQSARDAALGRRVNPASLEAEIEAGRKALGPEYEAALNSARAVNTLPLAQRLEALAINERGPGQTAANNVRGMLNIPGNPQALDPHPRALLATRRAIDGMKGDTLDANVQRILGGARREVDAELASAVPGIKTIDGNFQELSNQSRGLQRGQEVFDTSRNTFIRPEQFAEEMASAATPKGVVAGPSAEPLRIRQGMNAEVDRLFATGVDDLRSMESTFRKPANIEKLGIGFGNENAKTLVDAITANRRMRDTYNAVDRGSQTAQRQAANEAISGAEMRLPESGGASGLAIRGLNKALQFLSGRSSDRTRSDLADFLSMQGPEAQRELIKIFLSNSNAKQAGEAVRAFAINPGGINARVGGVLSSRPEDQKPMRR